MVQQLSCCREEGRLLTDRMTLSSVNLLVVIGLFLVWHAIGHVVRLSEGLEGRDIEPDLVLDHKSAFTQLNCV